MHDTSEQQSGGGLACGGGVKSAWTQQRRRNRLYLCAQMRGTALAQCPHVTFARRTLPGETVFMTRRCLSRQFFLRPDRDANQIFLYCLAVAAKKYGITIHALTVMSSHYHTVLTDPFAKRSDFAEKLNADIAKAIQALRGTRGGIWDKSAPNFTVLKTEQAVIEACAYTLVNPVTEGLVSDYRKWPGVTVSVDDIGRRTFTVRRPRFYFSNDESKWPSVVELPIEVPQGSDEQNFRRQLRAEVVERQSAARAKVRASKKRFLGRQRVLDTSPYRRAKSYETFGDRQPTFAVGKGNREAFFYAVKELRVFRAMYQEALAKWKSGIKDTLFPEGTYAMVKFHQVATTPLLI